MQYGKSKEQFAVHKKKKAVSSKQRAVSPLHDLRSLAGCPAIKTSCYCGMKIIQDFQKLKAEDRKQSRHYIASGHWRRLKSSRIFES